MANLKEQESFEGHELNIKPSLESNNTDELNDRQSSGYSGDKRDIDIAISNYNSTHLNNFKTDKLNQVSGLSNNDFERDPLSVRLDVADLEGSDKKGAVRGLKKEDSNQEFVDSLK